MEYPNEFMNAILIASAAFITVAGIILAFGSSRKIFGKTAASSLLISLLLGAASITTVLNWFNNPSDTIKVIALISLLLQFISWWVPSLRLVYSMGCD